MAIDKHLKNTSGLFSYAAKSCKELKDFVKLHCGCGFECYKAFV